MLRVAPRAAPSAPGLPAVVRAGERQQPHQREGGAPERNIARRPGRCRGHDAGRLGRGARNAHGHRQFRQYGGRGDHEAPRGHHGRGAHGRLRDRETHDHRFGLLAHSGLRRRHRQHQGHALREGPAALHQPWQRVRLAAADPQALLRAGEQKDQRPAGGFPEQQGPHGHRGR